MKGGEQVTRSGGMSASVASDSQGLESSGTFDTVRWPSSLLGDLVKSNTCVAVD